MFAKSIKTSISQGWRDFYRWHSFQDFHRWHLAADPNGINHLSTGAGFHNHPPYVPRTCASGIAQGAWRAPWHLRADKWWACHART